MRSAVLLWHEIMLNNQGRQQRWLTRGAGLDREPWAPPKSIRVSTRSICASLRFLASHRTFSFSITSYPRIFFAFLAITVLVQCQGRVQQVVDCRLVPTSGYCMVVATSWPGQPV